MSYHSKILGCLIGAAAGDAMGAATELRTTEQIKEYFGDYVTSFKKPPEDTFGRCNEAGMCTDDFIQGYYILEEIIKDKGLVSEDAVRRALRRWLDYPFYVNFTGPTTRAAMAALFNDQRQSLQGAIESKEPPINIINGGNTQGTNGGAMKIYPVGLINAGNPEQAIKDALLVTRVTHNNTLSISGACSMAAAIAEALSRAPTIASVVDSAHMGAVKGLELAKSCGAEAIAGAKISGKIKLAVSIAQKHRDWKTVIVELADIIGNGLLASDAVPAALGLFSMGDPLGAIYGSVNIGNDTDTIAIMAGALTGSFYGSSPFPEEYLQTINRMNHWDLNLTANQILDLCARA